MAIQTEKPIECVGCNTFDMKSLFDNHDCSQVIEYVYDSEEQAKEALAFFTQNLVKFNLKLQKWMMVIY